MSLRAMQVAIARLTCEAGELERYQLDPAAWCAAARVDAARMPGVAQLRRFREIHRRQRAHVLGAAPGERVDAYLAAHPYAEPEYARERARFAAFRSPSSSSG